MPFELYPYPNKSSLTKEYIKEAWENSISPLANKFGVEINMPDFSKQTYTNLAFEGYQYAKENNKGNEYNHRILNAYFQDGMNIGDIDVLTKLAGEIGLNEQEYREALENGKYEDIHKEMLQQAYYEMKVEVVPTFIIGNTRLEGVVSEETLKNAIDNELNKQ